MEAKASDERKRDPTKAQQLKNQGNQAWRSGDISLALKFYVDALYFDPFAPEIYRNRAAAYVSLKMYEAAIKDADQAIQLDNSVKSHFRKGEILFHYGISTNNLGAVEHALESFQTAFNIDKLPELQNAIEETLYYLVWLRANMSRLAVIESKENPENSNQLYVSQVNEAQVK